jgi:hypothetical protein
LLELAKQSTITNQQSLPESFARTGEAIVNQIRAFVAKNSPLPTSHFQLKAIS